MRICGIKPAQDSRVRGRQLRLDLAKPDQQLTARRTVQAGNSAVEEVQRRTSQPQRINRAADGSALANGFSSTHPNHPLTVLLQYSLGRFTQAGRCLNP